MSNAESIRTGINEALTDLGVMQRSLREASLKLAKNPNDTELAESLDQIERKMEGKQRHLKRLAAALEGAEQDAVEEARRAQEAEREAAVARCSDHRKELEKVAEEVETACARLIESLQAGAHHAGAAWGGRNAMPALSAGTSGSLTRSYAPPAPIWPSNLPGLAFRNASFLSPRSTPWATLICARSRAGTDYDRRNPCRRAVRRNNIPS